MKGTTATRAIGGSSGQTADEKPGHRGRTRLRRTLRTTATREIWWAWAATVPAVLTVAVLHGATPATSALTVAAMVPAALVDVRSRRLPDPLVALAALVLAGGLAFESLAGDPIGIAGVAAGSACFAGPLLAIHLAAPGSMGFGDVKAAAVLGAALGAVHWHLAISALALAAGLSATIAVLARARTIAFGPGLVTGAAIAVAASSVFLPVAPS